MDHRHFKGLSIVCSLTGLHKRLSFNNESHVSADGTNDVLSSDLAAATVPDDQGLDQAVVAENMPAAESSLCAGEELVAHGTLDIQQVLFVGLALR